VSRTLYVLVDPRDHRVRYVGVTVNPGVRRMQHRERPPSREKTPLAKWKRKLQRKHGSRPLFVPVLCCQTDEALYEAEIAWIRYYRARCLDLLNVADGGVRDMTKWRESKSGHMPWNKGKTFSDEARERMSSAARRRRASAETRAKMSAARMGHAVSDETRSRIGAKTRANATSKRPEVRARIAETLRGRTLPDDVKAKLRASQQLRRSRERWSQVP